MKTVPEIIRNSILEIYAMSTPEGYANIGERVVEALMASGYSIERPKDEPTLSPSQIAHFKAVYEAALMDDNGARQAFRFLKLPLHRLGFYGLEGTLKRVHRAIERLEPGWKRTASCSMLFGEENWRIEEPIRRKDLAEAGF